MRAIKTLSALFALGLLSACPDPAASCCDCLIAHSCWDHQSCPDDPVGSCLHVRGDADVPSYASQSLEVCYASEVACEKDNCASECEGFVE